MAAGDNTGFKPFFDGVDNFGGKGVFGNVSLLCKGKGVLNGIFQFAHVAGPIVIIENVLRFMVNERQFGTGTEFAVDLEAILKLPDPDGEQWCKIRQILTEIKKIPRE